MKKDDPFCNKAREAIAGKHSRQVQKDLIQFSEDQHKKSKPTIEISLHDCSLITQKIQEWERILKKAKKDGRGNDKAIDKIQKKIAQLGEIIFNIHASAKYSDELISKLYFSNYDVIEEIKMYYENWKNCNKFSKIEFSKIDTEMHGKVKDLISDLARDSDETDEYLLDYILNGGSYEIAVYFTNKDTGLSEARIKKKIKSIYKL